MQRTKKLKKIGIMFKASQQAPRDKTYKETKNAEYTTHTFILSVHTQYILYVYYIIQYKKKHV